MPIRWLYSTTPGRRCPNNVFSQLALKAGTNDTYSATGHEYRLAANATAKLTVIPQIIALPGVDETPVGRDIEIRGYVQITLPEVDGTAQSPRALKVLMTPQHRASFFQFPNEDSFDGGLIKNQIQSTLTTGNGAAIAEIEPVGVFVPPA